MREWKMQEWKMRGYIAGVENAGLENAGVNDRDWEYRNGKYGRPQRMESREESNAKKVNKTNAIWDTDAAVASLRIPASPPSVDPLPYDYPHETVLWEPMTL